MSAIAKPKRRKMMLRYDGKKIKAGISLMKYDRRTGNRTGWQRFDEATPYMPELNRRTSEMVLVVKSGPYKGTYASD